MLKDDFMNDKETSTYERLLDKSKEAFLLAVELYNRPSIRYHAEGCAFFLCNAWELMMKAKIIEKFGERAIYYKDNPERTISLNNCIALLLSNENDPLRINLERINELRNTSTHFVTDEYELFYGPLFQVCVKNFESKMREYHNFEISEIIPESYLVLSVKRDIVDPEKIRAKYPPEVAEKLLIMNNSVALGLGDDGSARYSGFYETNFVITKNPNKADLAVRLDKEATAGVTIVKEIQNVHDKYPYTTKMAINAIKERLNKLKIVLMCNGEERSFNQYHWTLFVNFYGLKAEDRYSHDRSLAGEKNSNYVYSQQAIDLVVDVIKQDPAHVIDRIKEEVGKSKK